MFNTIVQYCKDNMILTAVVAACLALILVSVIALCVIKSTSKKRAQNAPPTTEETVTATVENESTSEATQTPIVEEPVNEFTQAPAQEEQIIVPAEEEEKAPLVPKTPTVRAAKKPNEKPATRRSSRYAGKWVVCRVVTAAHAEGNLNDEAADETFFFELHASNGEKLLASEEYTTYQGAIAGIATHKTNIEKDRFRITLSKKGDYIFKLLNGKNMLLCMGEHYATKAGCESAIASTKRFAATAVVDENVQDMVIPNPAEEEETELPVPDNGYNGKWIIRAHTAEDGEQVFYFELFASNGEKLLSSEEYTTYTGAVNGIETHKTNIEKDRFRVSFTKRGDYIYKLLNGNNQLLCLGEHYKTRRRCENAIDSVKRFAKNALVLADPDTVKKRS